MSDSEDAFESADEGEETRAKHAAPGKPGPTEAKKQDSKEPADAKPKTQQEPKLVENKQANTKGKGGKKRGGKGAKNKGNQEKKASEESTQNQNVASTSDKSGKEDAMEEEVVEAKTVDEGSIEKERQSSVEKIEEKSQSIESTETSDDTKIATSKDEDDKATPDQTMSPEAQTIDRTNDNSEEKDEKPQPKAALDRLSGDSGENQGGGGWGWGGWGKSLITSASSSVATFSSQVGEGLQMVMDTVETGLGAPDPEDLAKSGQEEGEEKKDEEKEVQQTDSEKESPEESADSTKEAPASKDESEGASGGGGWFSSLGAGVSGLTSVVTNTTHLLEERTKSVVTGSLDVLETIGKKTYEAVAEGEHGLKSTLQRSRERPSLASLLREAKEDADVKAKHEEEFEEDRKSHFGAQFDDFKGLVQLEALEMLSNQCEGRVHSLLGSMEKSDLAKVKPELVAVKNAFEIEDIDDDDDDEKEQNFEELVTEYIGELGLMTSPVKLIESEKKFKSFLEHCEEEMEGENPKTPTEIHQAAIQNLAELTARVVEQFHKVAQLSLYEKGVSPSAFKNKAQSLANFTKVLCSEVGILSVKYTTCLNHVANKSEDSDSVTPLITAVYLEATNSSTYIQDAFKLLLPVLQQSTLEAQTEHSS